MSMCKYTTTVMITTVAIVTSSQSIVAEIDVRVNVGDGWTSCNCNGVVFVDEEGDFFLSAVRFLLYLPAAAEEEEKTVADADEGVTAAAIAITDGVLLLLLL